MLSCCTGPKKELICNHHHHRGSTSVPLPKIHQFSSLFPGHQKPEKLVPRPLKNNEHTPEIHETLIPRKSFFARLSMQKPRIRSHKRRNFDSESDKKVAWNETRTTIRISSLGAKTNSQKRLPKSFPNQWKSRIRELIHSLIFIASLYGLVTPTHVYGGQACCRRCFVEKL